MKKIMKQLLAFFMMLAMVMGLGVTAFAANNTYTITIDKSTSGHQYTAYQIFAGDLATDANGNNILSNITWGNGITEAGKTALGNAAEKAESLTTVADAKAFAKAVEEYLTNGYDSTYNEGTNYTIGNLPAGYYLIKDNATLDGSETYTEYMLKVVQDVSTEPKDSSVSFEKKVKDTNDTTGVTTEWQDSADYDIGDEVPFQLKGTVASDYEKYDTYKFIFHDKQETGLTFNKDSVKVYVNGNKITGNYTVVTSPDDDCTFEIKFDNLKDIDSVQAGSEITVEYTSTLSNTATIGKDGNVNEARLEFSNNPNGGGTTGKTDWDNVIVFTYDVVVNKYANSVEEANRLAGAEFTLEKVLADGTKKTITVTKFNDDKSFRFSGLDDGDYILTETTTPAGYNTIDPITFTVGADHKITWTTETRSEILTSLTGTAAAGNITFTANDDKSELSTDVINRSGATLPETGGIGTTIFYVVGGVLMAGAAILLITKKRMSTK